MKTKKSKVIIFLFLFLLIPLKPNAAERNTFGDVLDELAELQKQKAEKDNEIAISEAEYKKISNEIYNIAQEIAALSEQIQQADLDILENEKEIKRKKQQTDSVLRFLQLSNGEKAYLEYIFKATSFTDLIHRVSIVEQISKDNKEQIAYMNDLIKQNKELKEKNAATIKKQEAKKEENNKKMASLGSRISEIKSEGATVEESIEALEKEIAKMRETGCKNRGDLLSVCYPMVTDTGFLRPLKSGAVTSEYSWRYLNGVLDSHSGIDLGVPEGTSVYPVAAGKVGAIIYKSGCGGNMIYVYHTINGKQYTSVYMHLLSFGNYRVGDIVTASDVIGYTGGATTGTYRGGYDACTFGAHLHLTLATGHTTAHRRTMFNPREKINFPPMYVYWNKRNW